MGVTMVPTTRVYIMQMLGIIILFIATVTSNSLEKNEGSSGFIPSLGAAWDQVAMESKNLNISEKSLDDKEGRFGFINYGVPSTGSTGVTGLNGQLKLDLGGVVLGALIGFGAVVILPKIIHLLSSSTQQQQHSYSGYGYRSDDGLSSNSTSLVDILSRVDETLAQHNIDSSSCMQRVLCSYVRLAREKVAHGDASSLDVIMDSASNNSIVDFMLDGTSLQQAVNYGRSGGNCATEYARCPINKDTLAAAMKRLMSN